MKPTDAAASAPTTASKPPKTYKERHPNVVGRVPLALYQRLQAQMKATGQSMGQILRAALDPALRDRQADYDKGHSDGYEEGKNDYAVTYPCCKCGKTLLVASEGARADVAEVMPLRGWGCKECPPLASRVSTDRKTSLQGTETPQATVRVTVPADRNRRYPQSMVKEMVPSPIGT